MKLFVTDLDGTLLNRNREVTEYSKNIINNLIEQGIKFTVATARTPATAVEILDGLDLNIPVALMNGALIYDVKKEEYIDIKSIEKASVDKVLNIIEGHNKNALVYGIRDNHLWVYHKDFENPWEVNFYKERINKPLKTFYKVINYGEVISNSEIVNFVVFGEKEIIRNIYKQVQDVEEVYATYYEDVYYPGGYCLEIHSSKASKAEGIRFLSRYVEHNKLVCFGDNFNDIPMFQIADECYVTDNGVEEVKKIATAVIGSCEDDGVAKFLNKYYNTNN